MNLVASYLQDILVSLNNLTATTGGAWSIGRDPLQSLEEFAYLLKKKRTWATLPGDQTLHL